jgi:polyhydroxybutyrate depolymerase
MPLLMMRRMLGAIAATLVTLSLPVAADQPIYPHEVDALLVHDGRQRSYTIRIPRRIEQGQTRVPLVLVLHGGGGNARNAERMTSFTRVAEREGFIVAYPEGTGRRKDTLLTWNAGHCCGYAMENRVDDVGFIDALLDELISRYPIDPSRVYVTGMSNGAMMSHRLGMELSARIAAIAPVVGTLFGDEQTPPNPVAAIMINGLLDKSVPPPGGVPKGRFAVSWDGAPARPTLEQATFWGRSNGCGADVRRDDGSRYTHWYYPCPGGNDVELYLVKDNGHAWPGGVKGSPLGDQPSSSLDATDVIWRFFEAHSK